VRGEFGEVVEVKPQRARLRAAPEPDPDIEEAVEEEEEERESRRSPFWARGPLSFRRGGR
jgi:hypothetical protein